MLRTILALALLPASLALADDAKADLAGSYSYTTTSTVKLTSPAATSATNTETGELSVSASAKADLLFTWSSKGLVCHLHAKRVGATGVKFVKGETCTMEDEASRLDVTMTLVTGSGTVIDDELTLDMSWKLSGSLQGQVLAGSATERTSCEKH